MLRLGLHGVERDIDDAANQRARNDKDGKPNRYPQLNEGDARCLNEEQAHDGKGKHCEYREAIAMMLQSYLTHLTSDFLLMDGLISLEMWLEEQLLHPDQVSPGVGGLLVFPVAQSAVERLGPLCAPVGFENHP